MIRDQYAMIRDQYAIIRDQYAIIRESHSIFFACGRSLRARERFAGAGDRYEIAADACERVGRGAAHRRPVFELTTPRAAGRRSQSDPRDVDPPDRI
jgi:hypothetical protein